MKKLTMKELLQLLLFECIERDFKTMCSDGISRYTGMCSIIDDIAKEQLISEEQRLDLKRYIASKKPEGVEHGYWYESNNMRIKFLEDQISNN